MHGQRDLLDWQDENIKEGIERERRAGLSKHRRERDALDGEWRERTIRRWRVVSTYCIFLAFGS